MPDDFIELINQNSMSNRRRRCHRPKGFNKSLINTGKKVSVKQIRTDGYVIRPSWVIYGHIIGCHPTAGEKGCVNAIIAWRGGVEETKIQELYFPNPLP